MFARSVLDEFLDLIGLDLDLSVVVFRFLGAAGGSDNPSWQLKETKVAE
jgi:hypothetical protein